MGIDRLTRYSLGGYLVILVMMLQHLSCFCSSAKDTEKSAENELHLRSTVYQVREHRYRTQYMWPLVQLEAVKLKSSNMSHIMRFLV